jgi:glyoxylase-like metal-dependent hydrolase (beta-lactamase superfamily II)
MFPHPARVLRAAVASVLLGWAALPGTPAVARRGPAALRLDVVGAETDAAFRVTAVIIAGPTESIVWDGHYKVSDGTRLADRIAATGTRLKAIVISHADHDHYMGAMEVVKRFPGTPVYMTASTLQDFADRSAKDLAMERKRPGPEVPETLVTPVLLPAAPLTVDGQRLEVLPDFVGDVRKPVSSVMWIPSLRAALVADLAFSGVHAWLGDSDSASRAAWKASLTRIAELKPAIIVPGHKADLAGADSPDILAFMQDYLTDFETLMQNAATADEVVAAMRKKYAPLRLPILMSSGTRDFRKG